MNMLSPELIGRSVGWRVAFTSPRLAIDHRHCWADITVSLDGGLSPGSVELSIRGLTPEDFRALALARGPGGATGARAALTGTVQLFWRDRVGDEPEEALAQPIAHFAVTSLSRRNEGIRTLTAIAGRNAMFDRLSRATTASSETPTRAVGPLAAARQILIASGFSEGDDFTVPPATGPAISEAEIVIQPGAQTLSELRTLEDAMMHRYRRRGRGVYLIRDARLTVGPFRPIPAEGAVKELSVATGLMSAEIQGQDSAVAGNEAVAGPDPAPPPRDIWRIRHVGRVDIKPGDVVRFSAPAQGAELFSGFGLLPAPGAELPETQVTLYVSSVRHAVGVNTGWEMQLTGVTISGEPVGDNAWDVTSATTSSVPTTGEAGPRADAAGSVRASISSIAATEAASRPNSEIGEVRASFAETEMDGTTVRRSAHSSDLLVGAADTTGAGAARLADLRRTGHTRRAINVPYLTPFAWGPYGLVLPRYPGTRVMVGYNRGTAHDPVDMGALWRTNTDSATAAPVSQPGDWWLILPAGLGSQAEQESAGTGEVTIPESAKASHDLIDAQGERIIEVAGLTVRAYAEGSMKRPGERPSPPGGSSERGGIVIEHVDSGAHIKITTDGKISIKATDELVLEGKGIKLKPTSGTVDVQ